jgi:haloacid dehalogenase-like hydrolase
VAGPQEWGDCRIVIPTRPLTSWIDGVTKQTVVDFVIRVTARGGADYVPPAERVAVFDDDGTLWCEKPLPIDVMFIVRRLIVVAEQDGKLRDRQPWKAAHERDYPWLSSAIHGSCSGGSDGEALLDGARKALDGWSVEEYTATVATFVRQCHHPTLGCSFVGCSFVPMVELLRYLKENGFTAYIASGGDEYFMGVFTQAIFGIPPEHVIGHPSVLRRNEDVGIRSSGFRAGVKVSDGRWTRPRRSLDVVRSPPILAAGNSDADIPLLGLARVAPSRLQLLLLHDDANREFEYTAGAQRALEVAREESWTVVSMKHDWRTILAPRERARGGGLQTISG